MGATAHGDALCAGASRLKGLHAESLRLELALGVLAEEGAPDALAPLVLGAVVQRQTGFLYRTARARAPFLGLPFPVKGRAGVHGPLADKLFSFVAALFAESVAFGFPIEAHL